jgi:hypothetical protein
VKVFFLVMAMVAGLVAGVGWFFAFRWVTDDEEELVAPGCWLILVGSLVLFVSGKLGSEVNFGEDAAITLFGPAGFGVLAIIGISLLEDM